MSKEKLSAEKHSVEKLRIAVLVSGRGSNMEALAKAAKSGQLDAKLVVVLSDKQNAAALDIAQNYSIPTEILEYNKHSFPSKELYNKALAEVVLKYNPDLVVLAGFMKVLRKEFISVFSDRLINIHPSLLPDFPGLNVQQAAIDAKVAVSGCTVHAVTEEVDSGPIIGRAVVPVFPDDTADKLSARILIEEHKLLPAVVNAIANGKVRIECKNAKVSVVTDPTLLPDPNL